MAAISTVAQNIVQANKKYAENEFRNKALGKLDSAKPSKQLIVVTCMDSRIDPLTSLGLVEGEAHIIRNAGGLAKDAIRSILISQQLLGTRKIAIFRHSGCGMVTFEEPQTKREIAQKLGPESEKPLDKLDMMPFKDMDESLREDKEFLKTHPLIDPETEVVGFVYHVENGLLKQVV
ncbi:carbonate dehydratase-like protein [Atractiella rhizophila]|nr:carbonate dehydratase-like protein [Atractiella rhizophila]